MLLALAVTLALSLVSGELSLSHSGVIPGTKLIRFPAVLLLLSYALKERPTPPISLTERNTLKNRNENGGSNYLLRKERERRGLRTREYQDEGDDTPVPVYRVKSEPPSSSLKSSLKSTQQPSHGLPSLPVDTAATADANTTAPTTVQFKEPSTERNELAALRDFWSSPSVYPRAAGEGSGIAGYRSTREIYAKPSTVRLGGTTSKPNPSLLPSPSFATPTPTASTSALSLSVTTALVSRNAEKRSPSPILARRRRSLIGDRSNSPLRSAASSTAPTPRWVKEKILLSTKGGSECDLSDLRSKGDAKGEDAKEEDDSDYEDITESAASTPPTLLAELPPALPTPSRPLIPLAIPIAAHRFQESAGSTPYSSPVAAAQIPSLPFPPSKLSRRLVKSVDRPGVDAGLSEISV